MEPGGDNSSSSSTSHHSSSSSNVNDYYYASFARVAAGGGQAEGSALLGWAAATHAAEAGSADPGWRKAFGDSGPPRGLHRRVVTAFAPCTNIKLLERDLSKERHELLKDQRLFRDRARKHFLETNKRRRALEEKWKEEEEKEQKFREQILLQRRLKHRQATERFQRAPVSSSQRKKGVQTKPGLKLDEALNQIQETGLPLPTARVNGRPLDISSTPTRNGPFLWKQNPAKTVYDTLTQENNRTNLDSDQRLFQQNLDEMQQQLQAQHFGNLRDFHQEVNEITHSESVCSVDSLEAGEPNESSAIPSEASSLSTQLDSSCHHSLGSQTKNKSFSDETDMIFSKAQHVNNWLINLNTSNIQTASPFRDILIKYNVVPANEDTCSPDQKSSVSNTSEQGETERCSSEVNLTFSQNRNDDKSSLLKRSSSGTINTEGPLTNDRPLRKFNRAWTAPDSCSIASEQEKNSELPQNSSTSLAQISSQIAAAPVVLPIAEWSSTTSYNNSFLENYMQKGKEACAASCTEDKACVTGVSAEKYLDHINNETSEEPCKDSLDQQKDNREGRVSEVNITVPHADFTDNLSDLDIQVNDNANEKKEEKLPKSILKKESKYELGSFKAMVVNRGIRFGNQSVSLARDSIELAKSKGKEVDSQKNYKKLRWFDEINGVVEANNEEKCSEQSITEIPQVQQPPTPAFQIKTTASKTNLRSVPSCTINSVFPESHQEFSQMSAKLLTAGGSDGDSGTVRPFVSRTYHVAKQAWMPPRVEEIKVLPYNSDPKNAKSSPRKGRGKMNRRPKSAKAPSTFTPKNRKGTIIRPQSANEATRVIKTQGKIMVPHPPCKSIPSRKIDENPDTQIQINACKHSDAENSHCSNGRHPLPEDQDHTAADPSPQSTVCHPPNVTMRPSYSIFTYEPLKLTKRNANAAQPVSSSNNFIKRNLGYSENGVCPDRTPTDEEIAVLWQGVHRALAQKDGAAGDSQHYITHCVNSNNGDVQFTRPNVSHITIDGGNLKGTMKAGVRVNGIFSSQPSTAATMARRKQNNEHSENKRKALLEQRRQMTSAGWKPSNVGQNMVKAMKLGPYQCAYEPVQAKGGSSHSDEVSDSTTQFLLAENLANTGATEDEIVTGLDTAQPHKKTVVVNRAQRQGMSSLSLEEHKVLQSLERINQKLQSVQGTISKNLSTTSVLQTISPLVTSPSYVDITTPIQKYRSISADARALMQRRY